MNVSIFSKMAYEYKSDWTLGENKPNSNPILKIACQKIWPHHISIIWRIVNCIYEVGLIYCRKYGSAALRSRYEWEFPDFERS